MRRHRTMLGRGVVLATLAAFVAPFASSTAQQDTSPAPVPASPRWFKGNLHTHSLWSDGDDFPESIVDFYVRRGYHFLGLSDHNVLSVADRWIDVDDVDRRAGDQAFAKYVRRFGRQWVETRHREGEPEVRLKPLREFRTLFEEPGKFLLLQSEEITDQCQSGPIHLNASNIAEVVPPQGGQDVVSTIENNLRAVREQARRLGQPILVHLNHPNFHYAVTAEDLASAVSERFFEVYNGHPETHQMGDPDHIGIERMWDVINTIRIGELRQHPVYGLATDDSHNYFAANGAKPGRGWIMVRSRFLTPDALIRAMIMGDFYASSGVTLRRLYYDPSSRSLFVEVQPEPEAHYTIQFIGSREGYGPSPNSPDEATVNSSHSDWEGVGEVLETVEGLRARYTFKGDELYVRAVVTSSLAPESPSFPEQKAQAWTQPVGWFPRIVPPSGRRRAQPAVAEKGQTDSSSPGAPTPAAPSSEPASAPAEPSPAPPTAEAAPAGPAAD